MNRIFYIYFCFSLSLYAVNANSQNINFSGYEWAVKDSKGEIVGPGTNYFSDDYTRINEKGFLELNIIKKDGKWYCSEVSTIKSFGYGQYIFTVEPLPFFFNRNIVLGMFTFDKSVTSPHNEIDIEVSRWGKSQSNNCQYVLYEDSLKFKSHRFFNTHRKRTKYIFNWYPDSIVFSTSYQKGTYVFSKNADRVVIPYPSQGKAHINLWLYKNPQVLRKEFTVEISGFSFEPFNQ